MKSPIPGEKVLHVVEIESTIVDVLQVNHFTNTAIVRDSNNRKLLINQKKRGAATYQVVTELSNDDPATS